MRRRRVRQRRGDLPDPGSEERAERDLDASSRRSRREHRRDSGADAMSRRVLAALLSVAALVFAASCAGPVPSKDNDVRVAIYSNPASLSLIGNTDTSSTQIASLISDGLVAYDAQGNYVPMVARSWELSPDAKTLTFHLREGVLWQDGQPVSSKDVAFTVNKVRDPATQARSWVSLFANVASVDTPDDRTVVVHFTDVYADVLEPWRVP